MKGQLPKAYLRMDPNIDAHPDVEAIVLLMVWANRQPHRGRFKTLDTLRKLLGRKRLQACLDRHDLEPMEDGRWLLVKWDEWQEGDLTVGERMHRLRRNKVTPELRSDRNNAVTSPSPDRIAPSEALGVRRKKRTNGNGSTEGAAAPPMAHGWSQEFTDDFKAVYHAPPMEQHFKQVKDIAREYGWAKTRPAVQTYMARTAIEHLNIPKCVPVVILGGNSITTAAALMRPQARAPSTAAEKTAAAVDQVVREARRDG